MSSRPAALLLPIFFSALAAPTTARERVGGAPTALSIGSPTEGRLEGAVELSQSRVLSLRRLNNARWGLPRLVGMLERAAKRVNRLFEGSVLVVGDLSQKNGGEISGHQSHESGRDADVGFFFVTDQGELEKKGDFLGVDPGGNARQKPRLRFDDARNWALIESFITDREARIEHIFVSNEIRARLLRHGRLKGTYLPVLHRAALALKQPRRALAHDDHFHVRIACPPKQRDLCRANETPHVDKKAQSLVKPRKEREATRK